MVRPSTRATGKQNEEGIDVLIPLQLAKVGHEPTMHVFCGQNKLVEDRVKNLDSVEDKVENAIDALELGERGHRLYFTTHSPELATATRKGVWFTRDSLEKWLSRMGMPQCTQKRKADGPPMNSPEAKKVRTSSAERK
eukprot:Rhum_TRINITY_DN15478_c2_g2::Rhum_TRINITY_DN15478_c2_g2_i10::g.160512::m.160512